MGQLLKRVSHRVGKITYFGLKYGRGFGKQAAYLCPIFPGVPPLKSFLQYLVIGDLTRLALISVLDQLDVLLWNCMVEHEGLFL